MDYSLFPSGVHWALLSHALAIQSLRPLFDPFPPSFERAPDAWIDFVQVNSLSHSPWQALARIGFPLPHPETAYPVLLSVTLPAPDPLVNSLPSQLSGKWAFTVRCLCPACGSSATYSPTVEGFHLADALSSLACPKCQALVWPWLTPIVTGEPVPANIVRFPTLQKGALPHAPQK